MKYKVKFLDVWGGSEGELTSDLESISREISQKKSEFAKVEIYEVPETENLEQE